jgi:hypothetical protein
MVACELRGDLCLRCFFLYFLSAKFRRQYFVSNALAYTEIIGVDRGGSPGQDPPNHATRGGPPMDGPTQLLDKKK